MSNFMMNMISWVLLLLVILTLYLIDKINHLAKMYEAPKPEMPSVPDFEHDMPGDLLFSGLEGKKLWDAMNGKQVDGFDATLIEALRPHYEPILREHITATFKDGLEEGGEKQSAQLNAQDRYLAWPYSVVVAAATLGQHLSLRPRVRGQLCQ